jgi:hypothetical protein
MTRRLHVGDAAQRWQRGALRPGHETFVALAIVQNNRYAQKNFRGEGS